ncbi:MAG: hypothetical protein ACFWTX_09960 [Acidaminococcus timonensis]
MYVFYSIRNLHCSQTYLLPYKVSLGFTLFVIYIALKLPTSGIINSLRFTLFVIYIALKRVFVNCVLDTSFTLFVIYIALKH